MGWEGVRRWVRLHDEQNMLESLPEGAEYRRNQRAQVQGVNTMVKMGLPLVLVSLLQFLSTQQALTDVQDLHCIEFFAGVGRIAQSFRERGHQAAIFERDMDHYSRGQPARHTLMSSLNSNFQELIPMLILMQPIAHSFLETEVCMTCSARGG